ncbi:hypothetical protein EJ08DRAFT_580121 [Tothia fuscella]|uniref:Zn(2)-C6 fungal-type domain-containing protein n=1 Tax=Tothia fuscella TaxID=1048955 RepID=A0A9P4U3H7_9PEZI|nr:hypothetical protein EJ08DRAFT_580121 [Tothia fuscella]
MPAKRAHKKSRNGCGICRARRVKCDEVHPECGPCRKHEVRCNYDRAAFTPRRASSQIGSVSSPSTKSEIRASLWEQSLFPMDAIPPNFGQPSARMTDLQLMNHYTYMHMVGTCQHDPKVRQMWVYDVPQRAVGCDFLMQAILSFAALHLHIHKPSDPKMRVLSHHYFGTALRMLMLQLSRIGPHNSDMAFAASVMIQFQVFMSWKDPCGHGGDVYRPPVAWLEMCQGVGSILRTAFANVSNSFMKPLLEAGPNTLRGMVGPAPSTPESPKDYSRPFLLWGTFLRQDLTPDQYILKKTFDFAHDLYVASVNGLPKSASRRRLLTFPNALEPAFVDLLRKADPRAMITLSYYFGVMKMSQDIWWFHGRPEYEINGVYSILSEEWRQYMAWPREMIEEAANIPFGKKLFESFRTATIPTLE